MKRVLSITLAFTLILALCAAFAACGESKDEEVYSVDVDETMNYAGSHIDISNIKVANAEDEELSKPKGMWVRVTIEARESRSVEFNEFCDYIMKDDNMTYDGTAPSSVGLAGKRVDMDVMTGAMYLSKAYVYFDVDEGTKIDGDLLKYKSGR